MRVRDEDGNEVPWDGESFGELHVRGSTVISEYYNRPDANQEDFDGEWLKTGDIVSVDEHGFLNVSTGRTTSSRAAGSGSRVSN